MGFEKPPHIYGMHTLRDEKDVENLAEAYIKSAPLLGRSLIFLGWTHCFLDKWLHCEVTVNDGSLSHRLWTQVDKVLDYMTFFPDTCGLSRKLVLFGVASLALPHPQIRF